MHIVKLIDNINNYKYICPVVMCILIIAYIMLQLCGLHDNIVRWMQYPLIIIPIVAIIIIISTLNMCIALLLLIFMFAIILLPNNKTLHSIEPFYADDATASSDAHKDANKDNAIKQSKIINKKKVTKIKRANLNSDDGATIHKTISDSKTITKRIFNPNNNDDMNLLVTKEILNDMINRIEYNYENIAYLKIYIKSRIEEIITTNNLLND